MQGSGTSVLDAAGHSTARLCPRHLPHSEHLLEAPRSVMGTGAPRWGGSFLAIPRRTAQLLLKPYFVLLQPISGHGPSQAPIIFHPGFYNPCLSLAIPVPFTCPPNSLLHWAPSLSCPVRAQGTFPPAGAIRAVTRGCNHSVTSQERGSILLTTLPQSQKLTSSPGGAQQMGEDGWTGERHRHLL